MHRVTKTLDIEMKKADIVIQIIFFGIFQYNIVLIVSAIATLVTRATGLYCEISNHPSYGHFWVRISMLGCFPLSTSTMAYYNPGSIVRRHLRNVCHVLPRPVFLSVHRSSEGFEIQPDGVGEARLEKVVCQDRSLFLHVPERKSLAQFILNANHALKRQLLPTYSS